MTVQPLIIASLTLIALLAIGHLWPWDRFLGRELSRIEAYAWGTASIIAAFAVWCWQTGNLPAAYALAIISTAGGLSVVVLHRLRAFGHEVDRLRRKAYAYEVKRDER